jgi:hypothetical protein
MFSNVARSKAALDVIKIAAEWRDLLAAGYDPRYVRSLMTAKLLGLGPFPQPFELKPVPRPGDPLDSDAHLHALKQLRDDARALAKQAKLEMEHLEAHTHER